MATVVITVLCRAGQTRAVPEQVVVHPGDHLVFNFGRCEGTVIFPNPEALFTDPQPVYSTNGTGRIELVLLGSSVLRGNLVVESGRGMAEAFPYAIYCTDTREFAGRGSEPVIIIEE